MLRKLNSPPDGFTLIELMLVVVIIGILAMIAIPRFLEAATMTKQSEAKLILKEIYVGQRSYFQENGSYFLTGDVADTDHDLAFASIGVRITPTARYAYTLVGDQTNFTATATCLDLDDDATIDQWTIDQTGELLVVSNDYGD